MKFLQIHTFYGHYLTDFYRRYPHLAPATFDEQIDALVQDGFGAGHLFAPSMRELGYEAQLVIANCPQAQAQWAREHNIANVTPRNWILEIARRQVETLKPDILYLRNSITFDSHFMRSLSWRPALIIGWRAASILPKTDWSLFDVMLSSSTLCQQRAAELGAGSVEYFFPGFPYFIADACKNEPQKWDVVFSGYWTRAHVKRNEILREVAKASLDRGRELSIGFFIACSQPEALPAEVARHNQGARWGMEMFRALKSGRIILNASGDAFQNEAPNMRLFEVTGVGAFLLTEHQHNIQEFFEPGVEIETFRDTKELIEKIYYYVEHPEKREAIARRGQERCLREYSMQKRARELDAIIRKHLTRESAPSPVLEKGVVDNDRLSALRQNDRTGRETMHLNLIIGFDDLKVGQRVKVEGEPGVGNAFVAHKINMKASTDEAVVEGLIRGIDYQKNTLRLLNREFILPDGVEIRDLQRNIIGLKDLKAGDRVKLKGEYSERKGFVPEKINMKETTSFYLDKLQGDINKIDPEKKTLEVVGLTVRVNEHTRIF